MHTLHHTCTTRKHTDTHIYTYTHTHAHMDKHTYGQLDIYIQDRHTETWRHTNTHTHTHTYYTHLIRFCSIRQCFPQGHSVAPHIRLAIKLRKEDTLWSIPLQGQSSCVTGLKTRATTFKKEFTN